MLKKRMKALSRIFLKVGYINTEKTRCIKWAKKERIKCALQTIRGDS